MALLWAPAETSICLCGAPEPCACFSPSERRKLLNSFALTIDVPLLIQRPLTLEQSIHMVPCAECGHTIDSVRIEALEAGINPNTAICCEVVL